MASEHQRYVADRFPGRRDSVNRLCETDPDFDGLCRRYREISARLLVLAYAHLPCVEAEERHLQAECSEIADEIRNRTGQSAAKVVAA